MTKRDIAVSIAAKLLTGKGLEVAQLTTDALLKSAMKSDDVEGVKSFSRISEELEKLAKRDAGGGV